MTRTHVNFVIDALALAAFLALMSTGLILNFQLPPGSGDIHGRGHRNVMLLWDWTRHEWGQVHYLIACALVVVLAVHLVLHWKWIVCVMRGKSGSASGIRFGLGLAATLTLAVLAATPLMVSTETITRESLQQQRSELLPNVTAPAAIDLRGSMTLREVASEMNLTPQQFAERLGLPENVSPEERIGPLLRRHGLRMSDLRSLIGEDWSDDRTEASLR